MTGAVRILLAPIAAALALVAGCTSAPAAGGSDAAVQRIGHVVVVFAENHSFDNLYGMFPGADGVANATPAQYTQLDHDRTPLRELITFGPDGKPDPRFPRMPNAPFRIDAPPVNRMISELVPSPIHAYFHSREQIDGGRNDLFAAMSTVGGWTMGYYDGSRFQLWQWAREYTLADRFFMGAFGGSYLNHFYLVCACAAHFDNAPATMRVRLDPDGRLTKQPGSPSGNVGAVQVYSAGGGQVGPDGLSVNTTQPPYQPSGVPPAPNGALALADPAGAQGAGLPLPPQHMRTIGDALSAKGVDWVWYAGGWNDALADGMRPASAKREVIYSRTDGSPMFQPHHQPFNYFARFAPGSAQRAAHLKDADDLMRDIDAGTLPPVAFFKPAGRYTQHPSYTDIKSGDEYMAKLLARLRASPQWQDMLVILTYDENGGYWDHVAPPAGPGWGDELGPGTRIPTILAGPTVKHGYVDHTTYDTASILKFITRRWRLEPLPGVRANMGDLSGALQP